MCFESDGRAAEIPRVFEQNSYPRTQEEAFAPEDSMAIRHVYLFDCPNEQCLDHTVLSRQSLGTIQLRAASDDCSNRLIFGKRHHMPKVFTALDFACPTCGARPQEPCRLTSGEPQFHIERYDVAQTYRAAMFIRKMPPVPLVKKLK